MPEDIRQIPSRINLSDYRENLICPQCGAVGLAEGSSAITCRFCSSNLLHPKESVAEHFARTTKLNNCLNYESEARKNPTVGRLFQGITSGLEELSPTSVSSRLSKLTYLEFDNSTRVTENFSPEILSQRRDYLEDTFLRSLYDRATFWYYIRNLPIENFGSYRSIGRGTRDSAYLNLAHANGVFTTLSLNSYNFNEGSEAQPQELAGHAHLNSIKWSSFPDTENDFYADSVGYRSSNTAVIDNLSVRVTVHPDYPIDTVELTDIDRSLLMFDPNQVTFESFKAYLSSRDTLASRYGHWTAFLVAQEEAIEAAVHWKVAQALEIGSLPYREVPTDLAVKTDDFESKFIDKQLESGNSIACSECGGAVSGYDKTKPILRCGHCGSFQDVLGSGFISPDALDNKEIVYIPFEFLLVTMVDVMTEGHDNETISDLFRQPKDEADLVDKKRMLSHLMIEILEKYPYLFQAFAGGSGVHTKRGASLHLEMPTVSNLVIPTKEGPIQLDLPSEIVGKILAIRVEEGNSMISGYNREGIPATIETAIFSVDDLESLDIDEWCDAFDGMLPYTRSWLNRLEIEFYHPLVTLTDRRTVAAGIDLSLGDRLAKAANKVPIQAVLKNSELD